jgi:hypothetical protein
VCVRVCMCVCVSAWLVYRDVHGEEAKDAEEAGDGGRQVVTPGDRGWRRSCPCAVSRACVLSAGA